MWKVLPFFPRVGLSYKHSFKVVQRTFLSDAFRLEKAWNERLSSPILKKIKVNDMFYELDHQFQHFANASALDIDLFVNAVDDDTNFDEVDDIVHKLRLSPEAISIMPSTQHALIRLYLKFKKTKDLIRILDDRLNYGIFPDDYCMLLLIDTFIKEGNFRDAAKVGSLSMLQEDVSNPLIKYMSLYACHKYLENPVPWSDEESIPQEDANDDDDEEVKVRVKYIRNPFFDDHFDLVDYKCIIGKTLHFIGAELDDHVGRTYSLLGLILHEKFTEATNYVKSLSSKESKVFVKDGLNLVKNVLDEILKDTTKDNFQAELNELKNIVDCFTDSHLVTEENLLSLVEIRLKDLVNKSETVEYNKQLQLYADWEKNRDVLLREQIAKINREKQLAEIQRQKQLLQEKEEEIFFFDHEDKLDLIIEEKEKRKEVQRERERKILEAKNPPKKKRTTGKTPSIEPPLFDFVDENIPMKLIKTKL